VGQGAKGDLAKLTILTGAGPVVETAQGRLRHRDLSWEGDLKSGMRLIPSERICPLCDAAARCRAVWFRTQNQAGGGRIPGRTMRNPKSYGRIKFFK
jgi:hypothetical protein